VNPGVVSSIEIDEINEVIVSYRLEFGQQPSSLNWNIKSG